jgi:arylsulfatase A-like enzyme
VALAGSVALTVAVGAAAEPVPAQQARQRPNFVFFLIDDMGWRDTGCYGSTFYETPNIDRLARQGMRFTDAYAACPVCSPTRASIMTGKYPARLRLTDWIPGEGNAPGHLLRVPEWRQYLPLEEITLARALKAAGYVSASIGKWHLGGPAYFPEHHGFDVNVGGSNIGQPASYFWPYQGKGNNVPGLKPGGRAGEYLTDRLTDEAERFIQQNHDRPFFLYFPHYAVHMPLQAKPVVLAKYKAKPPRGGQKNPTYAAMIESVDQSVGRILARLHALGIADRTVVLFTSDNGGLWPEATSNAPLRAGKGYPYEGGIREPLIVNWPGVVQPGSTCSVPVSSIDFFPTLLEIAGVRPQGAVDGRSLVPLLRHGDCPNFRGPGTVAERWSAGTDRVPACGWRWSAVPDENGTVPLRALYWHYPHYWSGNQVRPFGAVRAGDWKLIEFYEDMRVELYNIREDIGESRNLAGAQPAKAAELRDMLHRWRQSVAAQMPTPNPRYDPKKASRAAADQADPALWLRMADD